MQLGRQQVERLRPFPRATDTSGRCGGRLYSHSGRRVNVLMRLQVPLLCCAASCRVLTVRLNCVKTRACHLFEVAKCS
jgi:hypothetical protein